MIPKVFGVGFHKTGTSSLGAALELLGYRVCGPVGYLKPDIADTLHDTAFALIDDYDAFEDNPWPVLYRELDERVPGSRFILTIRDPSAWIRSIVRHFGGATTPMRELIYGAGRGDPRGNETHYVARYQRHNTDVTAHFRGRSDLLVMDLAAGHGWGPLCGFLGAPRPEVAFPHLNEAAQREASPGTPGRYSHLLGGLPYGKGGTP
ncbi:MAG TPA: sulfotransferase [Kofleriaceae bacterium]|nr:sulfotransferase [Kofleriaceae bacterium]